MTGAVFETVSELILLGFVPSLVTVATVWIIWLVLEKINPDEVADIRTFLTFIIAVVPFVMLICSGLGVVIHDEMMAASVGLRSLPLASFSREIFAGAAFYIGLTVWLWSYWRKLRIHQRGETASGSR
jgi:ABC-type Fe3+-siderophore transport system permease subunit